MSSPRTGQSLTTWPTSKVPLQPSWNGGPSPNGTPEICDKKYDNYANFSRDVRAVQPHQVLAINRGESQKVLTVKLVLPPRLAPGSSTSASRACATWA
ncbi:hypothetical protein MTO96_040698 [Rhipicephalus appendiculatus]